MSISNDRPMKEVFFVVAMTNIRHNKMMLYIREGWVREMHVYTKPYNKAVYTKLKLHPAFDQVAPLEVREWINYNTTADENVARDVYITSHGRGRRNT